MKKFLLSIIILATTLIPAASFAQLSTVQGGTGTTSPSGILYGDGTLHMKTVKIGANVTFSGGTLSASGGSGNTYGWPWTLLTNYGTTTNATTTPSWFQTGVYASSTSQFTFASTTAISATTICLTGDVCRTTWPTGGSGGAGNVSTSSVPVVGQIPFWTTTTATPALLSTVATTSLGVTAPITFSGTLFAQIGGAGGTFGCTNASNGVTGCMTALDWGLLHTATTTFSSGVIYSPSTNAATLDETFGGVNTAASSTWTGHLSLNTASTTQLTAPTLWTGIINPAGTLVAVDPNGKLIATTSSAGGVTSVSGTWPILSTGGATPVISWGGISTSSAGTTGYATFWTSASALGATSSVFFASNQNVGVGSTTPFYLLSVGSGFGVDSLGNATTSNLAVNTGVTGTTTLQVGSTGNPACVVTTDTVAGTSYTYWKGGIMFVSTTGCN